MNNKCLVLYLYKFKLTHTFLFRKNKLLLRFHNDSSDDITQSGGKIISFHILKTSMKMEQTVSNGRIPNEHIVHVSSSLEICLC